MRNLMKEKHKKNLTQENRNYLNEEFQEEIATNNEFIKSLHKEDTYTNNGAVSNSTSGSLLIDDFAQSSTYRERDINDVFTDMNAMWSIDPEKTLKTIFYIRMITRKSKGFVVTETLQKGQGNKDESIKRMLWLAYNHPKVFNKNLWLIPVVGTWKDLFTLLSIDTENRINKKKVFKLMKKGLSDDYNIDLIKKYLPQIKSSSKTKTVRAQLLNKLAKEFRAYMKLDPKSYRLLKTSGKAHEFQQDISNSLYSEINWDKVPGKALSNIVSSKFLYNHNLVDQFMKWLDKKDTLNYNGYPYELLSKANKLDYRNIIEKKTIDKQFDNLIEKSKEDAKISGNILCALDTSCSMTCPVANNITAYDVCISLGIYFSTLNTGAFKNTVAMFDNKSYTKTLTGSFTDKLEQIKATETAWGSTNFQSIINLLVEKRETTDIPLKDYPDTILVVSDMQFNSSGSKTNYDVAMEKLNKVGLGKIKIIWWNVNGMANDDLPSTLEDEGTYFLSGFDGAVVSMIIGDEKVEVEEKSKKQLSMLEVYENVLNQDILKQVSLT